MGQVTNPALGIGGLLIMRSEGTWTFDVGQVTKPAVPLV